MQIPVKEFYIREHKQCNGGFRNANNCESKKSHHNPIISEAF